MKNTQITVVLIALFVGCGPGRVAPELVELVPPPGEYVSELNDLTAGWRAGACKSGRLFVADMNKYQVHLFDEEFQIRTSVGAQGEGPGEFLEINNIAVSDNFVFVYDAAFRRISKFDHNLDYIMSMPVKHRILSLAAVSDSVLIGSVFEMNYWSLIRFSGRDFSVETALIQENTRQPFLGSVSVFADDKNVVAGKNFTNEFYLIDSETGKVIPRPNPHLPAMASFVTMAGTALPEAVVWRHLWVHNNSIYIAASENEDDLQLFVSVIDGDDFIAYNYRSNSGYLVPCEEYFLRITSDGVFKHPHPPSSPPKGELNDKN